MCATQPTHYSIEEFKKLNQHKNKKKYILCCYNSHKNIAQIIKIQIFFLVCATQPTYYSNRKLFKQSIYLKTKKIIDGLTKLITSKTSLAIFRITPGRSGLQIILSQATLKTWKYHSILGRTQ